MRTGTAAFPSGLASGYSRGLYFHDDDHRDRAPDREPINWKSAAGRLREISPAIGQLTRQEVEKQYPPKPPSGTPIPTPSSLRPEKAACRHRPPSPPFDNRVPIRSTGHRLAKAPPALLSPSSASSAPLRQSRSNPARSHHRFQDPTASVDALHDPALRHSGRPSASPPPPSKGERGAAQVRI